MQERRTATIGRRDAQIGVLLFLVGPVVAYLLQVAGVPLGTYYAVVTVTWGSALLFLIYVHIRLGRDYLARLFPHWASKWPHRNLVYLLLVGFVFWYLLATTWKVEASLYRLVYLELAAGFVLEAYAAVGTGQVKRTRFGTDTR